MADLEGSAGGGLTRVGWSAMVVKDLFVEGYPWASCWRDVEVVNTMGCKSERY